MASNKDLSSYVLVNCVKLQRFAVGKGVSKELAGVNYGTREGTREFYFLTRSDNFYVV